MFQALEFSIIFSVLSLIVALITSNSFPKVSKFFFKAFIVNLIIGILLLNYLKGPPG